MTVIPALGRWEAGDQEFKAILGYVESSGPAWDSGDPVSKKQNKTIHLWKKCATRNEHV